MAVQIFKPYVIDIQDQKSFSIGLDKLPTMSQYIQLCSYFPDEGGNFNTFLGSLLLLQ
jgi:hypothetical protein